MAFKPELFDFRGVILAGYFYSGDPKNNPLFDQPPPALWGGFGVGTFDTTVNLQGRLPPYNTEEMNSSFHSNVSGMDFPSYRFKLVLPRGV
jgi:hypothetical protein